MEFRKKLKLTREAAGLTQKELAARLNITPSAACFLEKRPGTPKMSTIERIAAALDCDIACLTDAPLKLRNADEAEILDLYRELKLEDKHTVYYLLTRLHRKA